MQKKEFVRSNKPRDDVHHQHAHGESLAEPKELKSQHRTKTQPQQTRTGNNEQHTENDDKGFVPLRNVGGRRTTSQQIFVGRIQAGWLAGLAHYLLRSLRSCLAPSSSTAVSSQVAIMIMKGDEQHARRGGKQARQPERSDRKRRVERERERERAREKPWQPRA